MFQIAVGRMRSDGDLFRVSLCQITKFYNNRVLALKGFPQSPGFYDLTVGAMTMRYNIYSSRVCFGVSAPKETVPIAMLNCYQLSTQC